MSEVASRQENVADCSSCHAKRIVREPPCYAARLHHANDPQNAAIRHSHLRRRNDERDKTPVHADYSYNSFKRRRKLNPA